MDRETLLPLMIGLVLALAAHLGGAAGFTALSLREQGAVTKPPVPRADLRVERLNVPEPRVAGEATGIELAVINDGEADAADFAIEVMLGEGLLQKLTLHRTLRPGEMAELSLPSIVNKPGVHRVAVTVDVDGDIEESDEGNNSREAFFIWVSPSQGDPGAGAGADLAVFGLKIAEPRIVQRPVEVTVRIANLGGPSAEGTLQLLLDGTPIGDPTTLPPLPGGEVDELRFEIITDKAGEHEVTAVIEPTAAPGSPGSPDANPANNRISEKANWLEQEKITSGQLAPSPLRINWISEQDYQALLARRAKFDQATAQQAVEPVEAKQTPVDPTPPAPRPSVAMRSPSAQPGDQNAAPQQVTDRPENPDQPSQKMTPLPDLPHAPVPSQAPALPDFPGGRAAAAVVGESRPPTMIDPAGNPTAPPQPIVDDTATTEPVAAPPLPGAPAEQMKITSPTIAAADGETPLLPRVDQLKPADKIEAKSPPVPPDPRGNPTDSTMLVEGPEPTPLTPPTLAALPLPPQPEAAPGSPQQVKELNRPDADKTQIPRRPVNPDKPDADGSEPTPTPVMKPTATPTPPQPQQSPAPPSDPTAAPKQQREVMPVSRIEGEVKPGEVIARYGVEVRTTNPRFSTIALRTSAPANPKVIVIFNRAGQVVDAKITRTSGYDNVDGPILASLYKWTATGEPLQRIPTDEKLTLEITMLLNDLDEE